MSAINADAYMQELNGLDVSEVHHSVAVTVTALETASAIVKYVVEAHGPQFQATYTGDFDDETLSKPNVIFRSIRSNWNGLLPADELFIELVPGQVAPTPPTPPEVEPPA